MTAKYQPDWIMGLIVLVCACVLITFIPRPVHLDHQSQLIKQTRIHASDVCHANGQLAVVDILDDGSVDWWCYWASGPPVHP